MHSSMREFRLVYYILSSEKMLLTVHISAITIVLRAATCYNINGKGEFFLKRLLMKELLRWKDHEFRKPLILWGARQVGKTWLMKEFGRSCFKQSVYVSFYNNRKMAAIFEEDYSISRIIQALEIELHVEINPKDTILLFDEVQYAPKVVESLKYFQEDAPQYYVIAAGSLLGVAIHEGVSFPVGKVDELWLHPLSFQEFLMARSEVQLAAFLSNPESPEINTFRDRYIGFLREYMIIGGMPEIVNRFSLHLDYAEAREMQLSILNQYEGDFGKHTAPVLLPRIRMAWNAIPVQLAKENRKFFFGQVKTGARMKDFELALQWLHDAGLVHLVHKVEKPAMPLKSYEDLSAFKVYMIDIGLLGALSELDMDSVRRGNEIFVEFKGALTEQFVLQQIISSTTYTPYYYSGDKSTYETDFLIQKGRSILPIEVKAEENLRSKSARFYFEKFQPPYVIRLSMASAKDQGWIRNIPLWAVQGI